MNYLDSAEIHDFWGDRYIKIPFNKNVNFLIGPNGSGKTTIINLIAAALTADFHSLDRLPFQRLILNLTQIGGTRKPSIEVEKIIQDNSPYPQITFRIKDKASENPTTYSLDQLEEERFIRAYRYEYLDDIPPPPPPVYRRRLRTASRGIREHLQALAETRWLSVHRAVSSHSREERSFESSVDQKLAELSNELIKYFSSLNRQAEIETENFQQSIFLSLLSTGNEREDVFRYSKQLDLKKEKEALIDIFRLFNLDEGIFLDRVERHFSSYAKARRSIDKKKSSIGLEDFLVLIGTRRIHSVVQEWNRLKEKEDKIYDDRDKFISVLNSLLLRKKVVISVKNELVAETDSGKILPLRYLSSGEKQLIILLGEGLLQAKKPIIYIADEPELSLHVLWQEKLVNNILSINPNAQIIFATHSPDIVSFFGECVIDMEKILV